LILCSMRLAKEGKLWPKTEAAAQKIRLKLARLSPIYKSGSRRRSRL